jgi:hypothetical protein
MFYGINFLDDCMITFGGDSIIVVMHIWCHVNSDQFLLLDIIYNFVLFSDRPSETSAVYVEKFLLFL